MKKEKRKKINHGKKNCGEEKRRVSGQVGRKSSEIKMKRKKEKKKLKDGIC